MKKILLLAFLLLSSVIIAQPVTLFEQFNGRYDFTAFGNTLNTAANPCNILTQSSANFTMPPGGTLVAAKLYWGGSGPGDFNVELNGSAVTAERTFGINFNGLDFFAAYADVTDIVNLNGNGTYTLADLDLTAVIPAYCGNATDFGGWSVTVIFENPALLLNQISLFDGLEFVSSTNPTLDITLTNIDVATDDLAKIGFLAWEGDAGLAVNESLIINGTLIDNPPLNPGNNAFNGTNSYTGTSDMYNMDLDFYDLENIVNPGDTMIPISLTSGQDFVMINNIITNVNSEIPDATIVIDDLGVLCANNNIDVDYTVYNVNSTAPLPANTPIAFYADAVLIGQSQTFTEIPIDGSESGSITLNIPVGTPVLFDLIAVVDDDGTGNGIVNETDETNNEFILPVDLNLLALPLGPDIDSCVGETVLLDTGIDDPLWSFQWFFNNVLIPGATGPSLPVTVAGLYRVDAFEGICFVSDEITVTFNPNPVAVVPTDLELCDELPNDGFGIFDLTTKDAEIMNGQANTFVEYYESLTAAQNGLFPIPTPTAYANIVQGFQTVWARLESTDPGECFDIVPLNLQVFDSPAITDPISDYFICDNDGDGIEIFDLTSKDAEILNILVNVTLTYHQSQPEAEAGLNPIMPANAYGSGGEVIWVRGENSAGCYTVGSFGLILGSIPSFVEVPVFEQCDNDGDGVEDFDLNMQNATIVDGNLALSVSYHPTQVDADANTNPLAIPYTSAGETIYVRVEDNMTGCYGTFAMDLVVVMAPEIFQPDPLTYCDDDNDGFGEFTLTDADEDVVNGNPSGNLVVSYHETLADAQNNVNALVSPYANVDPFLQTVYVRLTDIATGCYSTTTLLLIVQDSPLINDPQPLVVCDDDNDGFALFDLTQAEAEILGSLNPSDYTITYYEDPALSIAIVNTTAYPNLSNPQTIYVVVEDISNGCQGQTTLELQVNLPPQINAPTPLELCDVNNPGDEMEPFNLESKTFEITGGDPGIVITYHETQADADTGANALSSPYVNQVPQPQTIYIRAVGATTGCVTSQGFTLDLVVNPVPSPVTPTPLEVCDADNDGFALFDLNSKNTEIAGGELVAITYHETLADAQAGIFALSSPYQNIVSGSQTVYARATYSPINPPPFNTGCYRVVELELIAVPTPVVPLTLDPLVICDPEGNGVETFDLTLQDAAVLGSQDPGEHTITYHESLASAQAGTPFIGTPTAYQNTSNPQTIWVRLTHNGSGCFAITSFELQTPEGPGVTQPTPLSVCDDVGEPNDGVTLFDLTVKNDEITGGVLGVGVQYYETLADAQNNTNAIDPATAYENISNPQTVFVRVTDGNSGCVDTTVSLTLRVNANPEPGTPEALSLCDVNDPGDGMEVFDLTQAALQITGGSPWDLTYHESYQEAFDGLNAIVDPTMYTNTSSPQTIYVRVENNTIPEGCFEIVELVLIVDPLPDATAVITPLILCEVPSDGFGLFDLSSKIEEILGGQDPGIFQVSFYESQAEADAQLNPILNTTSYPNTTNPQTIYVGILNSDTGCYIAQQSFEIEEREGAVATTPDPYIICDNVEPNDGLGEFVLDGSTAESQVVIDQILGGQDPSVYLLSFHPTLEDAHANTNALGSPFANTINPQLIYARVENSGTDCYDITQVILKVEELPEVFLEESYRLCVDANGNPIPQEEGSLSPPVIDTGLDPALYSFEWFIDGQLQLGQDDPSIVALSGGTYSVIVTENNSGCSTEAVTTVTISSPPLAWDAQVVTPAFAGAHAIQATAEGLGEYSFQLDDGPFQSEGLFEGVLPGMHLVTIKDVNGCGSVTVEVSIIDYPRFVTPNQDGYHDTWNIIGIAGGDPTAKIYIFDRFGKLLKQLSPLGEGWDGTYNGNPMPSSDYWFLVEYTEDETRKEFKGHFTLKR
ncbi:hypothetical protein C5O00_01915 [Pukyongia salina]|uniref:Uncharacterized protein n=1 Tax=Pukyongia salina TaxID=2094025 RepID=A0A2S0HTM5_9FLAO|nr:T9SS type B sorting domain-containing protein [Pukyongia salina]AVI49986.1 hypothetical protein C5O00_01915 [Pukyongia salina]